MKKWIGLVVLYLCSALSTAYAQDCNAILAQLPDYSNDNSQFGQQMRVFLIKCSQREDASNPQSNEACVRAGLGALCTGGNYMACEMMAKINCQQQQFHLVKQFMIPVLNSPYAPPFDREIAKQVIDSIQE